MSNEEDDNNIVDDSNEESINENEQKEEIQDNQDEKEDVEEEQQEKKDVKKNENKINQKKEISQPSNQQKKEIKKETKAEKKNLNPTIKNKINQKSKKTKTKSTSQIAAFPNGKKSKNSQLAESLYSQLLNNKNNIDIYSNILKYYDDSLSSKKPSKPKESKEQAFQNLIERQKAFEDNKNNYIKSQQEKKDSELKNKCTWQPETNYKDQPKRKLNEFLDSQKEFLQTKKEFIDKMEKNLKEKEKEQTNVKLCSKTSEEIVKKKNNGEEETNENFYKRLYEEKLKNVKKKNDNKNNNEKNNNENEKAQVIKKSQKEIDEAMNKLYNDNKKLIENFENQRKEKILNEVKQSEMNLMSKTSKKFILDKFITNFNKTLLELFNKSENSNITFEQYQNLLKGIGCIKTENKIEEDLIKLSFDKYLNQKENEVETNFVMLFCFSFLGIYNGNDEKIEEEENKNKKSNNNNLNKNNNNEKKITSVEFIKNNFPELDLNKYSYPGKTVNVIKKKFFIFRTNLMSLWNEEINKKWKEKRLKNEIKPEKAKKTAKEMLYLENSRQKRFNELQESNTDIKLDSNKLKIEDTYQLMQKKQEKNLEIARKKKIEEEMKNCTFHPNSYTNNNNNKTITKNIQTSIEKLYTDGKTSLLKKSKKNPNEHELTQNEKENCTFQPKIYSNLHTEIFYENPLNEDTKLKEEMNKLKTLRENKKRKNKILFSDDEEDYVPFRFDLEMKSNRDTIEHKIRKVHTGKKNMNNINIGNNLNNNNYEKQNINLNLFDNDINEKGEEPLLKVEVNINDENQTEKLLIYPSDVPSKITDDFCKKYNLADDKKKKLEMIIKQKLKEVEKKNKKGKNKSKSKNKKNKKDKKNDNKVENKNKENEKDENEKNDNEKNEENIKENENKEEENKDNKNKENNNEEEKEKEENNEKENSKNEDENKEKENSKNEEENNKEENNVKNEEENNEKENSKNEEENNVKNEEENNDKENSKNEDENKK